MSAYLKLYLALSFILLLLTEAINLIVDPLWYGKGNLVTGRNFSFNERISKTNLLIQTKSQNYDCLIFGSSRVTLLKASAFEGQNCFNYSFSAGTIEEFVEYAKFAKDQGVEPKRVYVGVDAFNFSEEPVAVSAEMVQPQPRLLAYLSLDVLNFSTRTLLGMSPDPRYYNRSFESEVIEELPQFKPEFFDSQSLKTCDTGKVEQYQALKAVFPQAEFIGYVPPISAWNVVNEVYARGLTDCTLDAFYQLSDIYDEMYDFSIPSTTTTQVKNTYDGSHFYPDVQDQVSQVLQGNADSFGIEVDRYEVDEYKELYRQRIATFLRREDEGKRWQAGL